MKIYLIIVYAIFYFVAPAQSIASAGSAASPLSILDSKEDDYCTKKSQVDADISHYHDCLNKELTQPMKLLGEKYEEKIKEIRFSEDYNLYDSIGSDRKSLRPEIESSYKNVHKTWVAYRDSYCKNIVSGNITGDGAFVGFIACTINMNKRRFEEINLMYNPASAW